MPDASFVESQGGILIPADEKPRGVFTNDDFRALRRVANMLKAQGIDLALGCATCHQQLVEARRKTGELQFSCKCRDRVLEGIYATSK